MLGLACNINVLYDNTQLNTLNAMGKSERTKGGLCQIIRMFMRLGWISANAILARRSHMTSYEVEVLSRRDSNECTSTTVAIGVIMGISDGAGPYESSETWILQPRQSAQIILEQATHSAVWIYLR